MLLNFGNLNERCEIWFAFKSVVSYTNDVQHFAEILKNANNYMSTWLETTGGF